MNEDAFFSLCEEKRYDRKDIQKFREALAFAKEHLLDKKRLAGDTLFDHNLRVGAILVDNRAYPEAILAGLLHGTSEQEEVKALFGEDILRLILEMDEVKRIKEKNPLIEAEALRKIILTTLNDVRVILVKLANKLDNMYSVQALPEKEQERISTEVLEVYGPLANRLGLEKIKNALENLAFKNLYPRKYREIEDFLKESSDERERNVREAISIITTTIAGKVEIVKIKGRSKQAYSIFRKIQAKKISLNDLYDLIGIRIIVPEIKDCYTLLGLLHENFEPLAGRLKDYIANPKLNLYQSIHTGVQLPNSKIAEIQIRTPEMDEIAEEGIAAHWQYKGFKSDQLFEKKVSWLKSVLDLQSTTENKEFLEAVKVDVFGDVIYCYTPKGKVVELPKSSSVLDFAYNVHEEIGNHAVAGKVNGKFVPLKHQLERNDIVEVLTNKNQRPRRSWIKIVKSSRARQKIRKSLKEHETLSAFHYHRLKPLIKEDQGILVEAVEYPKAVCILARCCRPLPGNEIIGIVTKRRIISVHKTSCRAALKEEDRWVDVSWKNSFAQKIQFVVNAGERSGVLADLLHTIASAGFEVKEAKAKMIDIGYVECSFLVVPRDLEHLKGLVEKIKKVKGVQRIFFE